VLPALVIATVVLFVGTLLVLPVLVARIPADYFAEPEPPPSRWYKSPPWVRWTVRVLKNVVGGVLVVAGVVMIVTPGQGILTLLMGLVLIDFPGKRRLELRLVRNAKVLGALNWIRGKADRAPLEVWHGD
jgi:hypothetical protein